MAKKKPAKLGKLKKKEASGKGGKRKKGLPERRLKLAAKKPLLPAVEPRFRPALPPIGLAESVKMALDMEEWTDE